MPKGSTRRIGEAVEEPNEVRYATWPPRPRPALSLARTFLPLLRRGEVTIADIMATHGYPVRQVIEFLTDLEQDGRIVRAGGEPGRPLRWSLPGAQP